MNDSGEFQDVESICSGQFSHAPSQLAIVPSPRGMLSRDQSLRPDTWNLLGASGNVFDSPLAPVDSSSTLYRGMIHSWNVNATDGDPVRPSTENEIETPLPPPRFARRPSTMHEFFLSSGNTTEIRRVIDKNFRCRSFILTNFPR